LFPELIPVPLCPPSKAVEDWLYDEGEDVTKSVYIAKLEELKKTGGPIELRHDEDQTRGPAMTALRQAADAFLALARSDSPAHAHIEAAEREIVTKEAEAVLKWLGECSTIGCGLWGWFVPNGNTMFLHCWPMDAD
jgi:hypothetical protein